MKTTPAEDAACDRLIALAIAAVYHGLAGVGNGPRSYENTPLHVLDTAELFRKYIEKGDIR